MVDVSVLISCFNKEKYIDECVSSVLRQTKLPKEIIVVHDACDNPLHHKDATSIILKDNSGVANARDVAFKYSTGELILFLDGDDCLSPDYIEKMVLTIASGADVAYPDIYLWADKGSRLTTTPDKLTAEWVKDFEKVVIPVTSMIKRSVYEKVGGFKDMVVLEDMDFWVRVMKAGFEFKKSHTLLWYRRYPETRNSISLEIRKKVFAEILSQL